MHSSPKIAKMKFEVSWEIVSYQKKPVKTSGKFDFNPLPFPSLPFPFRRPSFLPSHFPSCHFSFSPSHHTGTRHTNTSADIHSTSSQANAKKHTLRLQLCASWPAATQILRRGLRNWPPPRQRRPSRRQPGSGEEENED